MQFRTAHAISAIRSLLAAAGAVAVSAVAGPGPADACREGSVAVEVGGEPACVEEVRFASGSLVLAGQWFRPQVEDAVPAVVVIRGSGESERGNAWTESLAGVLVAEGLGVLLPDKRGSDESEGDWRTASFEDLAGDAVAAVAYLGGRDDVDGARVGLMGLSQGGQVVPIAGARSDSVGFLIDVVGSAVPFVENVKFEMLNTFREEGLSGSELSAAAVMLDVAVGYVRGALSWGAYRSALTDTERVVGSRITDAYFIDTADDWRWDFFRRMADFDPVEWWRRVDQPTLVLLGEADANTDTEATAGRLRAVFEESGHPDATVRVFEGLGHSLWDMSGAMRDHRLDPEVRRVLGGWVDRVTRGAR